MSWDRRWSRPPVAGPAHKVPAWPGQAWWGYPKGASCRSSSVCIPASGAGLDNRDAARSVQLSFSA